MAAEKSAAEKLLLKHGGTLWLSDESLLGVIGELPPGAALAELQRANVAVVAAPDSNALRATLKEHAAALRTAPVLWVAYPKGNRTDINRDTLWPILGEIGLRPVSQVALTDVWSALRFRPLKPDEALPGR